MFSKAHACKLAICLLSLIVCARLVVAQGVPPNTEPAARAPRTLQELVDEAARVALSRFAGKGLEEKNLAITLIDLRATANGTRLSEMMRQPPRMASFRGDVPI